MAGLWRAALDPSHMPRALVTLQLCDLEAVGERPLPKLQSYKVTGIVVRRSTSCASQSSATDHKAEDSGA